MSDTQVHPLAVIHWDQADEERRRRLLDRGLDKIFDPALQESIAAIIEDVREHGDAAVLRALERFDGCRLEAGQLRVSDEEFERARHGLDAAVLEAARMAIANIRAFNEHATREREWRLELEPGLMVGERLTPIASAGLFIPSGKGSFPSVLTQLGTPAVVAGVPEIAVVVPPVPGGQGEVDPAVLASPRNSGCATSSGPTGRPEWRRSPSGPRRSPRSARWWGRAARPCRPPRSSASASAATPRCCAGRRRA